MFILPSVCVCAEALKLADPLSKEFCKRSINKIRTAEEGWASVELTCTATETHK